MAISVPSLEMASDSRLLKLLFNNETNLYFIYFNMKQIFLKPDHKNVVT